MDTKPRCGFLFGQHSAFPQAIISRAWVVLVDEIGDTQRGETGITAPAKGSFAWSMALLIKQFRDLGIDMVIEEPIDELDDAGLRFDLLGG
jgi:hypothetical protein